MAQSNIVVGLDVGTSKVAVCVGQVSEGLVHLLALVKVPNSGFRRGIVIDIEDCVSSISGAIEQAEKIAGVQLDNAVVGVGGSDIISTLSKGVIAVSGTDGEITAGDVDRVIEAARAIALPPNKEILHVIPKQFIVDGQDGVKDPLGMTGIRLETEALVIGTGTSSLKNLSKCVYQAGLQINSLTFSPISLAKTILTKKQIENGVLLLEIGGGTTKIAVFEEGTLIHAKVLQVGSMHITNDLAIGLRISLDAAEKIKILHGNVNIQSSKKTGTIDLSKYDPTENQKIEKSMIGEIIEARLKEIFSLVKDELKSIGKDGMLPAGTLLTGGGVMLDGLVEMAKDELHLPAQIAIPNIEVSGMVDKLDHPVYATSVGLMMEGLESPSKSKIDISRFNIKLPKGLTGYTEKVKDIIKQLLP